MSDSPRDRCARVNSAHGPRYRVAQLRRAVGARPDAAALAAARSLLTPAQLALFMAMSPRDQWHSAESLRLLPPALRADADLAVAALLHDAGKGYVRLHERVLYVLLALAPPLLQRAAAPRGPRWRRALHRSLHHAETGARLARAAGASERAATLIRDHHAPNPTDPAAVALLAADERA